MKADTRTSLPAVVFQHYFSATWNGLNKISPSILIIFLMCCLLLPLPLFGHAKPNNPGVAAFRSGDFQTAVQYWQASLAKLSTEDNPGRYVDTLVRLAIAHLALGNSGKAFKMMREAISITEETGDDMRLATALSHLADVYLTIGESQEAWTYLEKAVAVINKVSHHPLLLANILNKQGNVLMVQGKYSEALSVYRKSVDLAQQADDSTLVAKTWVNIVEATLPLGIHRDTQDALRKALDQIQTLPPSQDKAFALISLAIFTQDSRADPTSKQENTLRLVAYRALELALDISESLQNTRIKSYALGHLAELYANAGRRSEAIQLTGRAIFFAQQSPELLTRWKTQLGRLLRAEKDLDGAIDAYRHALHHSQTIRQELQGGYRSLPTKSQTPVVPYLELVDVLLLKAAAQTTTPYMRHSLLNEATTSIERFSTAELQEFLVCSSPVLKTTTVRLDGVVSHRTAVLYPILLADRIELLLRLPEDIRQYNVATASAASVEDAAKRFRQRLEDFTPGEILRSGIDLQHSQLLYRWLIRPIASTLEEHNIETIIIVLHNPTLSSIPFAALHDGEQYLIEQYALVASPGLTITDPTPLSRDDAQVLLGGLSFTKLSQNPHVPEELQSISNLWGGDILLDKEFVISDLKKRLIDTSYSIIHLATHAHFDKNPASSFLQTYDAKLSMDRLEQLVRFKKIREQPLELITFSASETARGDERASLGLASIAIKAGARSALASLWPVSDSATAQLMVEFYRQWKDTHVSKAKALQGAQIQLLNDYEHPYFWAAFVLIGNWL